MTFLTKFRNPYGCSKVQERETKCFLGYTLWLFFEKKVWVSGPKFFLLTVACLRRTESFQTSKGPVLWVFWAWREAQAWPFSAISMNLIISTHSYCTYYAQQRFRYQKVWPASNELSMCRKFIVEQIWAFHFNLRKKIPERTIRIDWEIFFPDWRLIMFVFLNA